MLVLHTASLCFMKNCHGREVFSCRPQPNSEFRAFTSFLVTKVDYDIKPVYNTITVERRLSELIGTSDSSDNRT